MSKWRANIFIFVFGTGELSIELLVAHKRKKLWIQCLTPQNYTNFFWKSNWKNLEDYST